MATIALKHILVPTDFSETSRVALRYALALADRFGACVHLLHAVQSPLEQPWAAEIYAVSAPDFEAAARALTKPPELRALGAILGQIVTAHLEPLPERQVLSAALFSTVPCPLSPVP